ncbi:3-deoxy-8-phosphooctulonate synthase, partial [bacterium]
MAGPCVLEDPDEMLETATRLAGICEDLDVTYVFKSSFTKDNRTSAD